MASSFSNYPVAEECPHTEYKHEPDNNPVLRGLPLVVASTLCVPAYLGTYLLSNFGLLGRFFG